MRLIGYVIPIVLIALVACSGGDGEPASGSPANPPENKTRADAPIESIEIHKAAAKQPNASMIIVSGLPNGCAEFEGYSLTRTGDLFSLAVTNLTSAGPDVACTDDYRTVTTDIELEASVYGSIEECRHYEVEVNGERREVTFTFTPFQQSDSLACSK